MDAGWMDGKRMDGWKGGWMDLFFELTRVQKR